jgi:protease-4
MKQFLKFTLASCLGLFIGMALLTIGFFIFIAMLGSGSGKSTSVSSNSILELNFDTPVPERTNNVSRDIFATNDVIGLQDWVAAIRNAKTDPKIKGIFIKSQGLGTGQASAYVMRQALLDFKKSGKFITAYADYYTQGSFYMASVADTIWINPKGAFDFRGFASMIPFFKDMLDKIGVKPEAFYVGKFKSATEPYRFNKMSEENRLQTREYIEGLYGIYLQDISGSRNIPVATLREIASKIQGRDPDDALRLGLVDAIGYYDQVLADLSKRTGVKKAEDLNLVKMSTYHSSYKKKYSSSKNKIAVVNAEGIIQYSSESNPGSISTDQYTKLLREIRADKDIKAIVMRVNSGGGDALTSEMIWRELELAKAQGIKVVASMGDLAASGGYYISCNADSIFAQPNTITGSIGVFGLKFNMTELFNQKLGIHFDTVATSASAAGFTPFFNTSAEEAVATQMMVDSIYNDFISRVAAGRGKTKAEIHEIAQGRVWTGKKAVELGLVDRIGGYDDAVECAARMAKVKDYKIIEYPKVKEPIEQFMEQFMDTESRAKSSIIKAEMGDLYPVYEQFKALSEFKGVQARLPWVVSYNW